MSSLVSKSSNVGCVSATFRGRRALTRLIEKGVVSSSPNEWPLQPAKRRRTDVTPAALAYVYIGLGDKDQAFAWIEKVYQERSNFVTYLKVVPIVDSLRSDPRFSNIVRRVGLPQ